MTPLRTRDQERASFAWQFVNDPDFKPTMKDFATTCKQTAARVLNSGLAGAIAFGLGKPEKDSDHKAVISALARHLSPSRETPLKPDEFLAWLVQNDAATLRNKTEEGLAILQWLGRIADGKKREEDQ
jgi:CRISPR type III-B/RAMP module-associated protein Cmr5